MKKKYIIGNWKSNKTPVEVEEWFIQSKNLYEREKNSITEDIQIILCPSFVHLSQAYELSRKYNLPIRLGAQDISPFGIGAYTGEIAASQIADFVEYVIIGHSERRTFFGENETILTQKTKQALQAKLIPIYCIQDENTSIPPGISVVAYEPVFAIGTGKTETPTRANEVAQKVRQKIKVDTFIYGGSVTPDNIHSFLTLGYVDGVLPGGASLTPALFWEMIRNASHT